MSYALIVEYDGSNYSGFQVQANAPTIQSELEHALTIALRTPTRIQFAGRTDAGVHALGQVIKPVQQKDLILATPQNLVKSLNGLLPKDIAISSITQVKTDFHPRYTCLAREYEYLIWNHPFRSALWHKKTFWVREKLAVEKLNAQLQTILGHHDFAAFTPPVNKQQNTVRHIYSASLSVQKNAVGETTPLICFQICANGFLHNMIRILLGTLLKLPFNGMTTLKQVLNSRDRRLAGPTIPPTGLCFRCAYYPPNQEILTSPTKPCLSVWNRV